MFVKTLVTGALALAACGAFAQGKEIKIGVIYDLTGAFAAGGSNASYLGTKYAIDMINERGGVEGVKIKPVYVDAQSKADVAINETERLLNQEKVDMIMGVFSSAHCVPMAQKVDAAKSFMWANVCVASAVFKDKKLSNVFRAQVHLRPVRRGVLHVPEGGGEGEARQGAQGRQGRDHLRGRPLRRRRRGGQRERLQGLRHGGRAEGGLRGDRARPVAARDEAQARPAPT